MGDPAGIGPEVIVKALAAKNPKIKPQYFIILGDLFVISKIASVLKLNLKADIVDFANVPRAGFSWGRSDPRYGRAALEYIDAALGMIRRGVAKAVVTGPVNKSSVASSGVKFSGQTEYLARKTGT